MSYPSLTWLLLQVWSDAASNKGNELTAEEKWVLGTNLIATSGDPESAQRVRAETNNYYRLNRVLEVVLHTGKPMSDFEAKASSVAEYDFRW